MGSNAAVMLENSILVVAHPDDEVLWFSSVVDSVEKIIFCFQDIRSDERCSIGRKMSIHDYPKQNIACLGLNESEAFDGANWVAPVITEFGIAISKRSGKASCYKNNYKLLLTKLAVELEGYRNVITHNPWGEYGHEEHVQVCKVLKELQKHLKFNLWFSNYYSNKSVHLMKRYISGFDPEYITIKTNKKLAHNLRDMYVKNKCWTWFGDYEWPDEELFIKNKESHEGTFVSGHLSPTNFIKIDIQQKDTHKRKRWLYFKGGIKKLFFKLSHNRNHIH